MKKRKRFLKNRAHASASTPAPRRKKKAKAAGKVTRTDVKSTTIVRKNPRFESYTLDQLRVMLRNETLNYNLNRKQLGARDVTTIASKRDVGAIKSAIAKKIRKNPRKRHKARRTIRRVRRKIAAVKRRVMRRRKTSAAKCSYLAVRQGSKIMLARVQHSKAKRLGTFSMGGLRKYCAKHGIKMR